MIEAQEFRCVTKRERNQQVCVSPEIFFSSAFRVSPACAVMCSLVSDRKNEIADTTDPKFMSLLCSFSVAVEEI